MRSVYRPGRTLCLRLHRTGSGQRHDAGVLSVFPPSSGGAADRLNPVGVCDVCGCVPEALCAEAARYLKGKRESPLLGEEIQKHYQEYIQRNRAFVLAGTNEGGENTTVYLLIYLSPCVPGGRV